MSRKTKDQEPASESIDIDLPPPLDFGEAEPEPPPPDPAVEEAALVVSKNDHFSRAGYRFTQKPTLVIRAEVGEERWRQILAEGARGRFLAVSCIPLADATRLAAGAEAPKPMANEVNVLQAEIARLRTELDTVRKELALSRAVERRRGPARR